MTTKSVQPKLNPTTKVRIRTNRGKPVAAVLPVVADSVPETQIPVVPRIGATVGAEPNMLSIMDELSSFAVPAPTNLNRIRRHSTNPLRSRFFFRLDAPSDEELRRLELTEKPELPRSNKDLDDRSGSYSVELPDLMKGRIDLVREFMLQELAPRMMGGFTGVEQAKAILQRVIGGPVDDSTEHFFYQLMVKAANLRMSKFVAKYFDLPEREIQDLIQQLNYTRELIIERPNLGDPRFDVGTENEPKIDVGRGAKKGQALLPGTNGNGPGRRRRRGSSVPDGSGNGRK